MVISVILVIQKKIFLVNSIMELEIVQKKIVSIFYFFFNSFFLDFHIKN